MPSPVPVSAFTRFLFRRRWWVWGAFFAVSLACGFSAAKLEWRENILDLLPDQDPTVLEYREWAARFRPLDNIVFDVGPAAGPVAPEVLIAVGDALAGELQAAGGLFEKITWRTDPAGVLDTMAALRSHRANFFTARDQQALETKLTTDSIRLSLENWKKILTQSPAPVLAEAFRSDPAGVDQSLWETLQALHGLGGVRMVRDRMFSPDGAHLMVVARPRAASTDTKNARALVDCIERAIPKALQAAPGGAVRVAWLSGHRFALENAGRIQTDLARTLTIALGGICVLALLLFRRSLFVLLSLLPAAFGGLLAAGLVRWFEPQVSAIAIGCGSMLLGIGVDYGLHILYHADHALAPGEGKRDRGSDREVVAGVVQQLTSPLVLGTATTIAAFLLLRFSILPGYRQLGLFAALGILGASLFAHLAMPPIIPLLCGRKTRRAAVDLGGFYPVLLGWTDRHRRGLLAVLALATLAAVAGLPRVRFQGDYQKLNAMSDASRGDWEKVLADFGDALRMTPVAVRGRSLDAALAENERLAEELDKMRAEGRVADTFSLARLLPSPAVRAANRDRWLAFWSPARVEALRSALAGAARPLRMRPESFEPFLAEIARPPEDYDPARARPGIFAELVGAHLSESPADTLVLTQLRLNGPGDYLPVAERLRAAFPGVILANGQAFLARMIRLIYGELGRMALYVFLMVAALFWLSVRSWRRVGLLLLPLCVSAAWTFGCMGWADIEINLMNCIVVVFVFGMVDDYSIFLFFARESGTGDTDPHLARTGAAVLMSALTTLLGLGSLALARHPALHSIGQTALLSIGSGLAAVFLIVPLLAGKRSLRIPNQE